MVEAHIDLRWRRAGTGQSRPGDVDAGQANVQETVTLVDDGATDYRVGYSVTQGDTSFSRRAFRGEDGAPI
jgi:hypothetical protein